MYNVILSVFKPLILFIQSPCVVNKPVVIPKKRKFSNVSLDSADVDDILLPLVNSYSSVPLRNLTSESEISLEQTNEGQYLLLSIIFLMLVMEVVILDYKLHVVFIGGFRTGQFYYGRTRWTTVYFRQSESTECRNNYRRCECLVIFCNYSYRSCE